MPGDETAFDHFTGISVDGKALSKEDYTAEAGNVKVKLSDRFLEGLAVGEHTIKAEFDDGSAEAKFSVQAAQATIPQGSGESGNQATKNVVPQRTVSSANPVSNQVTAVGPVVAQTAKTAPVTGDSNGNVWIITAAVTGAAAAMLSGVVVYRKKRR